MIDVLYNRGEQTENLKRNLTKGFKKEVIECRGCGRLIEKKSNKTKYCEDCAREIEKEKTKKRVKKYRLNKKCNGLENAT